MQVPAGKTVVGVDVAEYEGENAGIAAVVAELELEIFGSVLFVKVHVVEDFVNL